MGKSSKIRWALGAGFGAVALSAGPVALAGEIRIDGGECASSVHLVARDAPLSDILKRLAKALDFQVSFESDTDPIVSVDATRSPIDLVVRLAPLENFSMTHAHNPRCPQRERIVKVWVLPNRPGRAANSALTSPSGRQALETNEQKRQAQAGIDMVLRAHGVPTKPGEQSGTN
jgi:hypothetical protein